MSRLHTQYAPNVIAQAREEIQREEFRQRVDDCKAAIRAKYNRRQRLSRALAYLKLALKEVLYGS